MFILTLVNQHWPLVNSRPGGPETQGRRRGDAGDAGETQGRRRGDAGETLGRRWGDAGETLGTLGDAGGTLEGRSVNK